MRIGCETMANAAEASASTARPRNKKAAQGETPAARKNGANKGTVKGREGESSRLPVNEPMTGTLEHRASRSAYRLVIKEEHEMEGTGKGTPRRRRMSRETRNEYVLRGPRLAVGLLDTRGRERKER